MKKDIEWLKSAIQQNLDFYNDKDEEWQMAKVRAYAKSLDLINQLDEPEVLSDKWISDHIIFNEKEDAEYIYADKLQNLLVPKLELPVIPNYVAKWISVHHERFDLYPALKRLENNALSWEDVYEWYRRNTHTFVNAYLTGKYEVEEEQKYIVRLPSSMQDAFPIVALGRTDKGNLSVRKNRVGTNLILHDKYQLTEQEIKDYDERYWTFAVKVKEMEE